MSPARGNQPGDLLAVLNRGKDRRAVRRPDAHLAPVEVPTLDQVPAPYDGHQADALDDEERADLATCERAVDGLQRAFSIAGKALATIQKARLYRETHDTFERYLEDRWGMKRAHAYRLIEAWPLAVALSPTGDTNERQVRALLPAAKAHGVETAAAIHAEFKAMDAKVTADRLERVVKALPATRVAPDEARALTRQVVATGRIPVPEQPGQDPEALEGLRAIGVLATALDQQRRIYDSLGDGVIAAAQLAEPARAEHLLREIGQYANRTAHRVRTTRTDGDGD